MCTLIQIIILLLLVGMAVILCHLNKENYQVIDDHFGQLQARGVGGWGGGTVTGSTRGNFQINGQECARGCWAGDGAMRITPECQFSYPPIPQCRGQ